MFCWGWEYKSGSKVIDPESHILIVAEYNFYFIFVFIENIIFDSNSYFKLEDQYLPYKQSIQYTKPLVRLDWHLCNLYSACRQPFISLGYPPGRNARKEVLAEQNKKTTHLQSAF